MSSRFHKHSVSVTWKPTMKIAFIILYVFILSSSLEAASILVFTPLPFFSHTNSFIPLFKELASRGHNITMVSPFPQKDPIPNWTDITIDLSRYSGRSIHNMINQSGRWFYPLLYKFCKGVMETGFQDKALMDFLQKDHSQFDLLILEPFFCQEPLVAISHKLKTPIIALHAMGLTPWYAYLTGNEVSFQLQPNMRSGYTDRMTFFQRLDNILISLVEFGLGYFKYIPEMQTMMDKYITYPGHESRPLLVDMLRNISLSLITYHFSVGYPEPLQPNTIPVGGLSLKSASQLPKDLKDILDNSKSGVIYFSFGSVLRKDHIPEGVVETMLAAFGELEQTVLFKWENNLTNKPKNVEIRKWFPQTNILAHSNVRIFITHGGLNSITEAVAFAVPVLCIPFFADQEYDARFTEQEGFGLTVLLDELTKENVLNALKRMLSESRFKEAALHRSQIMKDRPHTPMDTAVYWVEYVLRHGGAEHLKAARKDIPLYQLLGVDVLLFVAGVILVPMIVTRSLLQKRTPKEG